MRDIAVLTIVFACLPIIPFRPFLGLVVYAWLAYMRPHDLAWSLGSSQLSLWVALATLLGMVLAARRERLLTLRTQTILLLALGFWFALTSYTAVVPELSTKWTSIFLKIVFIALLTTGLVRSRSRFRILCLVIAFSLGLLALKYGLYAAVHGGSEFLDGPGGFMNDRNSFAVALNMAIPLLVAVGLTERIRALSIGAFLLIPFCIATILFTFSRGGVLTLAVVGTVLVWRSWHRLLAAVALALGLISFLVISSEQMQQRYFSRASTIARYEQDTSAMGRVKAWETSWRMVRDRPLVGVGPRNFMTVYSQYGAASERRVAHSSYFQMLAECGFPGFALFLGLLVVALWRLERVRRSAGSKWAEVYASMLQVSILAYAAGGVLLNLAYFDLYYQLVALTVCLEVVDKGEALEHRAAPTPDPVRWWLQEPASRPEGTR